MLRLFFFISQFFEFHIDLQALVYRLKLNFFTGICDKLSISLWHASQ